MCYCAEDVMDALVSVRISGSGEMLIYRVDPDSFIQVLFMLLVGVAQCCEKSDP